MSRAATVHLSARRAHFVLLVALLLCLQWDAAPVAHHVAGLADRPGVEHEVRDSLRGLNPGLEPRTLQRIGAAVARCETFYGLDPKLVTAVIQVESSARPWVRSPKGAVGLMQVMPHMMEPMALAGNATTIESNLEAGCSILAGNIRRLGEDNGISAYFWGSQIRSPAYLEKVRRARDVAFGPLQLASGAADPGGVLRSAAP